MISFALSLVYISKDYFHIRSHSEDLVDVNMVGEGGAVQPTTASYIVFTPKDPILLHIFMNTTFECMYNILLPHWWTFKLERAAISA